jgi:Icc-related predicted phosphoesterase
VYLLFFIHCLLVIAFYYAEPLITRCTIFGGDVPGNIDSPEIKNILNEKEVIEVEGKRIGVVHRHGLFFSDRKIENRFQGEKIDIFIHGHTHQLRKEKKGNIYYLNPGPFPKSMLIINLERGKEIEIEAIKL